MSGKYRVLFGLILTTLILISMPVLAEKRPIQASLFTPIQIFPETDPIEGFRLNLIYGRSVSLIGLDLGLVNHTTTGLSKGVQLGMVTIGDADFVGYQKSAVNAMKGNFEGFQLGLVNYAKFANGFQLGVVNYAGSMRGIQIGLINIIDKGGKFPVFPIVNWSF